MNITNDGSKKIFQDHHRALAKRTDRLFAWLFVFQWIMGMIFALSLSPRSWSGGTSTVHLHIYMAAFLGAVLSIFPIFLVFKRPGASINRMIIAIAQVGYSILYIHLTGGRIETHFHIFGSLAFLAFYRDMRPIIVATILTGIDHYLRGTFWPESVYGVMFASPWRTLEHVGWVLFEDVILFLAIKISLEEMRIIAQFSLEREAILKKSEKVVTEQTIELHHSQKTILEQQEALVQSSKLSALGEMSSHITHEINNPVGIIQGKAKLLLKHAQHNTLNDVILKEKLEQIVSMADKLNKIVLGLKSFSRKSDSDPMVLRSIGKIIEDALALCHERLATKEINVIVEPMPFIEINCRAVQIEQVLVNLLNNAYDAVSELQEKWIRISLRQMETAVEIRVIDSGLGIPPAILSKLTQSFFTTKPIGKGTGLGLSISRTILTQHAGELIYDPECPNTCFIVKLPVNTSSQIAS